MQTRTRGIRFILEASPEQKQNVHEYARRMRKLINLCSREIHAHCRDNIEQHEDLGSKSNTSAFPTYCENLCKSIFDLEYQRLNLGLQLARHGRSAAGMAGKFLAGYGKRGAVMDDGIYTRAYPPTAASTDNDKAIHFTDGILTVICDDEITTAPVYKNNKVRNDLVRLNGITLRLTLHNGIKEDFRVMIPKGHEHFLKFFRCDNRTPAGNLIVKGNSIVIILTVEEQFEHQYKFEDVLGIDFNTRPDCFVQFHDGTKIPRCDDAQYICDELKNLQKEIINPDITSRERRPLRLRWKKLHSELEVMMYALYVPKVIDKAISTKSALAIDDLLLPNNTSDGHYELKKVLIEECECLKLPYVKVKTWHTSSDCNHCFQETGKYYQVGRSQDKTTIYCPNCKKHYDADENAALNIRDDAKFILTKEGSKRIPSKKRPKKRPSYIEPSNVEDVPF